MNLEVCACGGDFRVWGETPKPLSAVSGGE
jgi:hypothetical protein